MVSPGFEAIANANIRNTKARKAEHDKYSRLYNAAISVVTGYESTTGQHVTVKSTAITELTNAILEVSNG